MARNEFFQKASIHSGIFEQAGNQRTSDDSQRKGDDTNGWRDRAKYDKCLEHLQKEDERGGEKARKRETVNNNDKKKLSAGKDGKRLICSAAMMGTSCCYRHHGYSIYVNRFLPLFNQPCPNPESIEIQYVILAGVFPFSYYVQCSEQYVCKFPIL